MKTKTEAEKSNDCLKKQYDYKTKKSGQMIARFFILYYNGNRL
jgi:hypothetical protein